jgi:hypothetical protein
MFRRKSSLPALNIPHHSSRIFDEFQYPRTYDSVNEPWKTLADPTRFECVTFAYEV